MHTILERIMATKRQEIASAKEANPESSLRDRLGDAPPVRDFFAALSAPGPLKLIAEVKKASPSKGLIRADFQPLDIARAYARGGATCLSVLTDVQYFQGSLEYLKAIRQVIDLPLLRKDFMIDRYQVLEARLAGADAILLIAECLDDCLLRSLLQEAHALGMAALVEFHEPENLTRVVDAGATMIGINNRDLRTFETDLQHTIRLSPQVPDDCVLVAESGIRSAADVQLLSAHGVDAILVGEHLMSQPDIGLAVKNLLSV
jgi:indole-3-glycerol phosphate synthase